MTSQAQMAAAFVDCDDAIIRQRAAPSTLCLHRQMSLEPDVELRGRSAAAAAKRTQCVSGLQYVRTVAHRKFIHKDRKRSDISRLLSEARNRNIESTGHVTTVDAGLHGRWSTLGVALSILVLMTIGDASAASDASTGRKLQQLSPCKAIVDDRLINLEPLQRVDGSPRYVSPTGDGWLFAFNPCSSFSLPSDTHSSSIDQCYYVAVCKYHLMNKTTPGDSDQYYTLGIQRTMRFRVYNGSKSNSTSGVFNPQTASPASNSRITRTKTTTGNSLFSLPSHVIIAATTTTTTGNNKSQPTSGNTETITRRYLTAADAAGAQKTSPQLAAAILTFTGERSMKRYKTFIHLVCDISRSTVDDGLFTSININVTNEYHFELHHRCCCPDACLDGVSLPSSLVQSSHIIDRQVLSNSSSLTAGISATKSVSGGLDASTVVANPPPKFFWLVIVVNLGIFVAALMIAGLCCRHAGGGLMSSGPYTYIPAINTSRATVNSVERVGVIGVSGSVGGLWTGQTIKPSASNTAEYRDYSSSAVLNSRLPILDNCLIASYAIDIGQRLGGGLFGDTYVCEWKDRPVAAKRITVGVHQNQLTPADHEWIINNIALLSKQRHQNLVSVIGICMDTRQPYIITEYIEGESLRDLMRRSLAEPFGWPQKTKMCVQAVDGMAFLHSAKTPVLHRDLRSANILVDKNGKVKIVDYGVTRIIQRLRNECDRGRSCYCQKELCAMPASLRWTAPEILANPQADDVTSPDLFTPACDVYSFGMVLWELATCSEPFEDITEETQVMQLVLDGARPNVDAIPRGTLPHYKELMKACWDQDPQSRPHFKQVAVFLKTIQQILNRMSSQRHRDRSDSLVSTTTSYLRSALNIASD